MMKKNIKKYPIASYFILTYAITWSLILYIVYPKLQNLESLEFKDVGMIYLVMLMGPSLIGLILKFTLYGKSGLKKMFLADSKGKNEHIWVFLSLFTTPIILIIVLYALTLLVSSEFLPGFQIIGIILGFAAGFFEEIGWTGYVLPEIRKRFSILKSGLMLGLVWGIWHLLADFLGAYTLMGASWLPTFLFRYVVAVTAYRIIMVFVYDKTKSLFLSMVMHGSFSASLFCFGPVTSYENGVVWNGVFAVVLSLVVGFAYVIFRLRAKNSILFKD